MRVTGGPGGGGITLSLQNDGKFPIYAVKLSVQDMDKFIEWGREPDASKYHSPFLENTFRTAEVSEVLPGTTVPLPQFHWPFPESVKHQSLAISLTARNGQFLYRLSYRRLANGQIVSAEQGAKIGQGILYTNIAPDFPRDAHDEPNWEDWK